MSKFTKPTKLKHYDMPHESSWTNKHWIKISQRSAEICFLLCFNCAALFQTLRSRGALFRHTLAPQVIAKQIDSFAHSCYPNGTFKFKKNAYLHRMEMLWGLTVFMKKELYMFIRWKAIRWGSWETNRLDCKVLLQVNSFGAYGE